MKRTTLTSLVLCSALLSLTSCGPAAKAPAPAGLTCSTLVNNPTCKVGDNIPLTFVLKNNSSVPIKLPGSPWSGGSCWIFASQGADPLTETKTLFAPVPIQVSGTTISEIAAGQELKIPPFSGVSLSSPGKKTMSLGLEITKEGAPANYDGWTGKIAAEPASFEVKP